MSFRVSMQEVLDNLQLSSIFKDPVEVGIYHSSSGVRHRRYSVGMHVKHVQVPIRPILRELGGAHVTALASRPKLIGGAWCSLPR